ncbi:MAG: pyruvate, phosphate dikinase [Alphaproteobacteria bacterium]
MSVSSPAEQMVYSFGDGTADGHAGMKDVLGGKGANLAEMCTLGLPVPPGFTIPTTVCMDFLAKGTWPAGLEDAVSAAINQIEQIVGRRFGDADAPLLVSVRSGARASMPGMMDTVLNLGLNDDTVKALVDASGDERFAWDSYRRFIQMYSDVVLGIDHHMFEDTLEDLKEERGYFRDLEMEAEDWRDLVVRYRALVAEELDEPFPQNVHDQLWGAIRAVFKSWTNARAITYRTLHNIPDDWGTAVNVQAMVFGNLDDDSATGVAFTRDPNTGERLLYGEFLVNAQGEDVVSGIRTPQHLTKASREHAGAKRPAMEEVMPRAYGQLVDICTQLETHYCDMQDIEFTVEQDRLWMLQTRSGKRTAKAALKIAVDLVDEGLIDQDQAIMRVDPAALDQLLHPTLDEEAGKTPALKGLPAAPGAAAGIVVFSADEAERQARDGVKVILVRHETSPEDIHGMHAAEAILTARGGMTSHAAVVARGMGKPCIVGAGTLKIDLEEGRATVLDTVINAGDTITIDGASGSVYLGEMPTIEPELTGEFATLMGWADARRRMKVRTNAETERDAKTAIKFGAEGIGLCRTEHMFFETDRIIPMREMILANDEAGRRAALEKLLPMQRGDFLELFYEMAGLPVTIRLLDPPLHEFLPHSDADMQDVADAAGVSLDDVKSRAESLHELNPMLGHRGCRLAVTYPEIAEMQTQAIIEAAIWAAKESGKAVVPEIMVPLVGSGGELAFVKDIIDRTAAAVMKAHDAQIDYQVGTMIELPRAALMADEIADHAGFFSFGTNDLTQTVFGISRDDAGGFLNDYQRKGVIDRDPFVSLDQQGVGKMVAMAAEGGRATRPDIKLGICGEHGGDPSSITFCEELGLDYVSCSPYRVPIARLAAAQAVLSKQD